jgi:hypothetical protein
VLAVLGRLDQALADAERGWDGLDPLLREGLLPPGELLAEAQEARDEAERRLEVVYSPAPPVPRRGWAL